VLLVAGGAFFYFNNLRTRAADYNPQITPADFTTKITNKYFALPVGKKMTYGTGGDRIEIEILPEKRVINGVETIIYLDREFKNGQLVEETKDYLAQHRTAMCGTSARTWITTRTANCRIIPAAFSTGRMGQRPASG
jgi:hypothetical protein